MIKLIGCLSINNFANELVNQTMETEDLHGGIRVAAVPGVRYFGDFRSSRL
jgi:hypothetical protein